MKKRPNPMAYFLIIAGVAAIVAGIVMLCNPGQDASSADTTSMSANSVNARQEAPAAMRQPDAAVASESLSASTSAAASAPANTASAPNSATTSASSQADAESSEYSDSKKKGDAFEDFVCNLLNDWRLKLLDRTQDKKSSAGVVAESSKNPDLHIQQKRGNSNIDYYIECKYRSRWNSGEVHFEGWQLERYRKFQKANKRKVIIALGVGGTPAKPAELMLVPLDSIHNDRIRQIDKQYVVSPSPDNFVRYIDNYFTTVFQTARSRKPRAAAD